MQEIQCFLFSFLSKKVESIFYDGKTHGKIRGILHMFLCSLYLVSLQMERFPGHQTKSTMESLK
jgi:hypothetical protein